MNTCPLTKVSLLSALIAISSAYLMTAQASPAFERTVVAQASGSTTGSANSSNSGSTSTTSPGASSAGDSDHMMNPSAQSFRQLDKNRDGFIDSTEAQGVFSASDQNNVIDTNKDGRISEAEFNTYRSANGMSTSDTKAARKSAKSRSRSTTQQ